MCRPACALMTSMHFGRDCSKQTASASIRQSGRLLLADQQLADDCRISRMFVVLLALTAIGAGFAKLEAGSPSGSSMPVFPLKVSTNKRYLVDQKDVPFLIVGDTPQGLMGRLSEHDAEIYFADREALGFNTAGWIDVTCAGPDYRDNVNATTPDGLQPFSGFVRLQALRPQQA
jgi:hypothetical protein